MWEILGLLTLAVTIYIDCKNKGTEDPILDVKFDIIAKFLAFMALVTCFRLAIYNMGTGAPDITILSQTPFHQLIFVWLEDAAFVLPFYLAWKYVKLKKIKWGLIAPLFLASIVCFCSGHLYQGMTTAIIVGIYPLLSWRYGAKYGFGTIMACHVLYDFITHLTIWMYWIYYSSITGT